jgi:hypothetical protein
MLMTLADRNTAVELISAGLVPVSDESFAVLAWAAILSGREA